MTVNTLGMLIKVIEWPAAIQWADMPPHRWHNFSSLCWALQYLHSWICYLMWGSISYWGFRLLLVINLMEVAGKCLSHCFCSMVGKPGPARTSVTKSSSKSPSAGKPKETKSTVECAALMAWDMPLVTGAICVKLDYVWYIIITPQHNELVNPVT
jgi:hypothetical protein